MRAPRLLVATLACLGLLTAAGCTASSGGSDPAPSGSGTLSTTSSATTSATASPSPTATGFTRSCEDALPLTAVSQASGQPIIGSTAFVVGEADTSIGRLGYLNCRYGLPTRTSKLPGLEIGVSLYTDAEHATDRVAGTVEDYRSTGSTPKDLRVGTATGTLLTAPGQPRTLVVASGARTVAVSIVGSLYTGDDQLVAIAALALTNVR